MVQKNKIKGNEIKSSYIEKLVELEKQLALLSQTERMLQSKVEALENSSKHWEQEKLELNKELSQAETNLGNLTEKLTQQGAELEKIQERFQKEE